MIEKRHRNILMKFFVVSANGIAHYNGRNGHILAHQTSIWLVLCVMAFYVNSSTQA